MLITKKAIPRRTVLRGLGATLALPLLDAMVPALTALQNTAAKPITRFGVMYVPNGMVMEQWTPAAEGVGFELTPTLAPLAPFRDDLLVLSNLACVPSPGRPGGAHAKASTRFLTDISPPTSETWLDAGISMDQIARQSRSARPRSSHRSSWRSNRRRRPGACDVGFACAYTNTISWLGPATPLPTENNPRAVFERLFGDSGSTDPRDAAALASDRTAACSTPCAMKSRTCRARSARAIASSSSSISRRFATSSGASRRPRSRATRNCRSSITPPASRRPTTSTSG